MTTRHQIIVSGCFAALVLVLAPFIWSAWHPSPQPVSVSVPVPVHGSFADRFQPKLEGIGSTRELPPVQLDGAGPAEESRHVRLRRTR